MAPKALEICANANWRWANLRLPYLIRNFTRIASLHYMVLSFLKHVAGFFHAEDPRSSAQAKKEMQLATQKVRTFLSRNNSSLTDVCLLIECAETRNELEVPFDHLDRVMRILTLAAPFADHKGIIIEALEELKFSDKLRLHLTTAATTHEAVMAYKTCVVQELALNKRKMEILFRRDNSFNEDLLATYFPKAISHQSEVEFSADGQLTDLCQSSLKKRCFSEMNQCATAMPMEVHHTIGSGNSQPTNKEIIAGRNKRSEDSKFVTAK